ARGAPPTPGLRSAHGGRRARGGRSLARGPARHRRGAPRQPGDPRASRPPGTRRARGGRAAARAVRVLPRRRARDRPPRRGAAISRVGVPGDLSGRTHAAGGPRARGARAAAGRRRAVVRVRPRSDRRAPRAARGGGGARARHASRRRRARRGESSARRERPRDSGERRGELATRTGVTPASRAAALRSSAPIRPTAKRVPDGLVIRTRALTNVGSATLEVSMARRRKGLRALRRATSRAALPDDARGGARRTADAKDAGGAAFSFTGGRIELDRNPDRALALSAGGAALRACRPRGIVSPRRHVYRAQVSPTTSNSSRSACMGVTPVPWRVDRFRWKSPCGLRRTRNGKRQIG